MLNYPKQCKILPMRFLGDGVLHGKTKKVVSVDDELRQFARLMIDTMYARDGVGLAAPQVGVSLRMIVLHVDPPTDEDGKLLRPLSPGESELCPKMPIVVLDPKIVSFSDVTETRDEGGLSVPGIYAPVTRPRDVVVEGKILDGPEFRLECTGLLARAFQHEIDHLDGIVFVQKVKDPFFEQALPGFKKIIKKSGAKNYQIKRLV
ncbi:MAG: peptide deformylase [Lentisphaeria bacterium]|nr:peptide deformylase [Lentisphaeria bacterium]